MFVWYWKLRHMLEKKLAFREPKTVTNAEAYYRVWQYGDWAMMYYQLLKIRGVSDREIEERTGIVVENDRIKIGSMKWNGGHPIKREES